jgi:antitoxin VapB
MASPGHEEADRLAREESAATTGTGDVAHRLWRLAAEVRRLPVLDDRDAEEIIGYDENGLPV